MPRIEIANEMQANSKGATANLEDMWIRREMGGYSEEFKHISPACPGLSIVAVVLFNKKPSRTRESSVVVCFRSFIMWYAFEPGKRNLIIILTRIVIKTHRKGYLQTLRFKHYKYKHTHIELIHITDKECWSCKKWLNKH
jgi:hypothetical protein